MGTRLRWLGACLAVGMVALGVHSAARQPSGWPGASWPQATPASPGFSSAAVNALNAIDRDARSGAYGNLDRLVVIRNGYIVVNHRYARDYRIISRGKSGPLGCGDGCTDAAKMHDYHYLGPNWHPYFFGPLLDALTADGQP